MARLLHFLINGVIGAAIAITILVSATNDITLQEALNALRSYDYYAWAASGLSAGQVPYATGPCTLAGDSGLTYNAATNTLRVGGANVTRTATYVIAASDAPAQAKAQADYVCDGADDQLTIEAVFSVLADGGTVQLTEGTFYLSDQLDLVSDMELWGMGSATELFLINIGGDPLCRVVLGSSVSNVVISDLLIDGNKAAQTPPLHGRHNLEFDNSSNVTVVRVYSINAGYSSGFGVRYSASDIVFDDCYAGNNDGAGFGTHSDGVRYVSCYSSGNGAQQLAAGFEMEQTGGVPNYCTFDDCVSVDDYAGFWLNGSYNTISDSTVINPTTYGIISHAAAGGNYNVVSGVKVYGAGSGGIRIYHSDTTLANNVVVDATGRSFSINGADNCHLIGNRAMNSTSTGYYVDGDYTKVVGNSANGTLGGIYVTSSYNTIADNYIASALANSSCIEIAADHNTIVGNIVKSGAREGILVSSSNYNIITSNEMTLNSIGGLKLNGVTNSIVANNLVYNNGGRGVNCYATDSTIFESNQIMSNTTSQLQFDGACDNDAIKNNILSGGTGTFVTGGSGHIISGNVGYVTENSGTDTIASGTTVTAVTHGLSITPDEEKITLVSLEIPTNAPIQLSVSANATATQFWVVASGDPGASNQDFGWSYSDN